MADVVYLRDWQTVPDNVGDHIMIKLDETNGLYEAVRHRMKPREIAYFGRPGAFEQVLDLAQENATASKISTIYVFGVHRA